MTPLVTRQSYMALNVEDLDASVRDAEDVLGLRVVDRHDGKAILTATGRRAELMLHQAPANAARAVGLKPTMPTRSRRRRRVRRQPA